jgi:hypothetical protein
MTALASSPNTAMRQAERFISMRRAPLAIGWQIGFFTTTLTKGTKESTKRILRSAQMIFVLPW